MTNLRNQDIEHLWLVQPVESVERDVSSSLMDPDVHNAALLGVNASFIMTTNEGSMLSSRSSLRSLANVGRPSSRAYIESLNERIAALEHALKEKDPRSEAVAGIDQQRASDDPSTIPNMISLEVDATRAQTRDLDEHQEDAITDFDATDGHSPPSNLSMPGNETMVNKLLSTRGHLSFDQLSGRLRYFGPTTNCHVHSNLHAQNEQAQRQALEQQRRTQKVINTLPVDTHDYLMDCFWKYYNTVIHVVHRAAFEDGREHGGQFYSGYLHVCILALGFRKADKSRPDIMRISLPNRESTLHQAAKFMLDYEIEQPTGILMIAALLLLGDLECGVGRDNLGWLYAGMANRLCFDIGLHLDRSNSGVPQQEIEIGRMTLFACVIYDQYWALFLGRPTGLKSSDLETYNLTEKFVKLGKCLPAGSDKSTETQVYESLLDLMEIAGRITEIDASRLDDNVNPNHHVFVLMANLNRELEIWYTRLPKALQWTPENVQSAPFSFFLLHQQYHVTMILLHRPFAKYGDAQPPTFENTDDYIPQPNIHLSSMSRTICTQHAVRVARIFWQHRQRFNTKQIFVTGLQHAGTAAIALVAALASLKDSSSRDANMHYLETLAAALEDMTETYQPAEQMSAVLQAVIMELKATLHQPNPRKVVPARRESSIDDDLLRTGSSKRHQSFRATSPRGLPRNTTPHPHPNATPPLHETEATPMSTTTTHMHPQTGLDGFVIINPQTDTSNLDGAWRSLSNANTSALDYSMFASNRSLNMHSNTTISTSQNSAWMGAETPAMSPPPSSHTFIFQPSDYQDHRPPNQALGTHNHDLDFLSLLPSDRSGFDGFRGTDGKYPLSPAPTVVQTSAFTARSSTEGIKPPVLRNDSASSKAPGSAARTMADLQGLLDKMRGSSQPS